MGPLKRLGIRIMEWWQAHFMWLEFATSFALAAVFVFWSERRGFDTVNAFLQGNRGAIYGALASIFGSLLGFSMATFSIMLGLSGAERLEILRKSDHYKTLWAVHKSTVRALSISTFTALAGLILDRDATQNRIVMYMNVCMSSLAIIRLARSVWVLEAVTNIITGSSKERAADIP